jgi:hypothetical protein
MPTALPTIDGYTIDVRLKEFRKMNLGEEPEFISFDSEKGQELLKEYYNELDKKREKRVGTENIALGEEMMVIEKEIIDGPWFSIDGLDF